MIRLRTNIKQKTSVKPFLVLVILVLNGLFLNVSAQSYDEARNLAFNGNRAKARQLCRAILAKGFDSDVALLLGRTYAWDGKYDSTRIVLNEVLSRNPNNMDALDAFVDVEYWSENYDKAIEYCDLALKKAPYSEDFLLKKARILHSNEKYKEAVATLEDFIQKYPGQAEVLKKLQEYRPDVMKNKLKISYTLDFFDKDFNRDPWQLTAFSYGRKTKLGSVIARVNMAQRFGDTGFQYELDAYPKISENNYLYLNYGFSKSSVFPENRFGVELYHNFPKSFEGSIGMRQLYFSSSNVSIFTVTLGKYVSNYWISLRSYVTPGSDGTSVSGQLQARRYFSDPENYIGLRLGYGVSPDDNQNLVDINSKSRLTLKTRSIRMEYNHIISRIWILNGGATWGNEELIQGSYSGYYSFDISIARLF
ncbi:MAG: YaiO family outer membrane beta-barrel protein [Prolixibacteraceae bacterium]|nr:YaiO family outer membrane beta-barrel protein [Prolixibacteraceae bacterium]